MQFAELHIFASWIRKTCYQMNLNVVIHSAIPDRQEVALRTMNDLKTFQLVHSWDSFNYESSYSHQYGYGQDDHP